MKTKTITYTDIIEGLAEGESPSDTATMEAKVLFPLGAMPKTAREELVSEALQLASIRYVERRTEALEELMARLQRTLELLASAGVTVRRVLRSPDGPGTRFLRDTIAVEYPAEVEASVHHLVELAKSRARRLFANG